MSLLFMDGFAMGDYAKKWIVTSGSLSVDQVNSRTTGGYSISSTSFGSILKQFSAAGEMFVGFAVRLTDSYWNRSIAYLVGESIYVQYVIECTPLGYLEVRRSESGGELLATGSTVLRNDRWHHIECRIKLTADSAMLQLRLNGLETNEIDFTEAVDIGAQLSLTSLYMYVKDNTRVTDVYILDSTGDAPCNTWLGRETIQTLRPRGNGASSDLVGSDSDQVDNFALVNEIPVSSSSYVGGSAGGDGDTYEMDSLPPDISTVHAVAWSASVAKSDAGARTAASLLRSGGSDHPGAAITLTTTYASVQEIHEEDPATSAAWSVAGVNAVEAGMKVNS
jgi:hypothetical protein